MCQSLHTCTSHLQVDRYASLWAARPPSVSIAPPHTSSFFLFIRPLPFLHPPLHLCIKHSEPFNFSVCLSLPLSACVCVMELNHHKCYTVTTVIKSLEQRSQNVICQSSKSFSLSLPSSYMNATQYFRTTSVTILIQYSLLTQHLHCQQCRAQVFSLTLSSASSPSLCFFSCNPQKRTDLCYRATCTHLQTKNY